MYEKLVIPEEEKLEIINRKKPTVDPKYYQPYRVDDELIPPMANFGEGYRFYSTGLTHNEKGYPDMSVETQDKLVRRLNDKIRKNKDAIIQYEKIEVADCDILVIAYGITSRSAATAIKEARKDGIKAGLLRLITLWPFPDNIISEVSSNVKEIIVSEMNYGQLVREVERASGSTKVSFIPKLGENPPKPEEIIQYLRSANR
jgi:2-oxoglutarate ferredoxin oxidoreductase subunit alpha